LREHVEAVNAERASRGLGMLEALHVENWPDGADVVGDPNIVFLEDDDARIRGGGGGGGGASSLLERRRRKKHEADDDEDDGPIGPGGTAIPPSSLYSSVCVGGTFDGMHYGHRKLLTLAVSSVQPVTGRLLIGVTRDEMLTHKAYADRIPSLDDRIAGVLDFVGNLAPGMKNRIRCVPISDEYGPPGQPVDSRVYPGLANDFDALVLSHETLPTGRKLNAYREGVLGLRPLKLLCTQRTEPHGMSSTALRRMRTKERM
jgi:cytidyltransferase-like protein